MKVWAPIAAGFIFASLIAAGVLYSTSPREERVQRLAEPFDPTTMCGTAKYQRHRIDGGNINTLEFCVAANGTVEGPFIRADWEGSKKLRIVEGQLAPVRGQSKILRVMDERMLRYEEHAFAIDNGHYGLSSEPQAMRQAYIDSLYARAQRAIDKANGFGP